MHDAVEPASIMRAYSTSGDTDECGVEQCIANAFSSLEGDSYKSSMSSTLGSTLARGAVKGFLSKGHSKSAHRETPVWQ